MRYAPAGDIGKFTNKAIANELDWRGDPDRLVEALVSAGWVEVSTCWRLVIHHWRDHADQTVKRYLEAHDIPWAENDLQSASKNASNSAGGNSDPDSLPVPVPVPVPKDSASTNAPMPEIPDYLKTIWPDWVKSRKVNRKPLTVIAVTRQLKKLAEYDHATAIEIVNYSAMNDYQGLLFDRFKSKADAKPERTTAEILGIGPDE